jgi:hypothetical protein
MRNFTHCGQNWLFALILLLTGMMPVKAAEGLWTDIQESAVRRTGDRFIVPNRYRTLHLDFNAMKQFLASAPVENPGNRIINGIVFSFPMPDGTINNFRIYETFVMDPDLAVLFPEIKTYMGQGIDDPSATIRLDITPLGFHAMILSAKGNIFIDPYCQFATEDYISYDKKDLNNNRNFICSAEDEDLSRSIQNAFNNQRSAGSQLRTYRLALACTGEYAATKGGTVSGAMSGMVTSMNRINGVYEQEVAIRMVMVANNSSIIYTNASTDPYSNSNGSTMLGQNITTCNNVIGSANYDIGHVFSTGGGGVAYLGCVCGSSKAGGVTGSPSPVNDPFDIDYVAHEMGHQFGGNHTFNSTTGSCGGGNRSASAAYEPGSGITIMAYAGICGSDDLAPNSIAYFHTKSFDEIQIYTTTGAGNGCAVVSNTGNTAPVVTSQGAAYSIPVSTPFVLTGVASDANGDPLTYSWEQYDLGTAGAWNANLGSAPIFRTFPPVTSPSRTFPKLSDIINNTTTVGEILPNVARTLHFRLTVRDNRSGGGGVMHDDNALAIAVVNNGGAFSVTAPNTAVSWAAGSSQTVTWNVNGTTNAPISCSSVKISLSNDGGNTFPTVLIASTANDGSEVITVPAISTTQARIKVEAINNIFFDMSNANFTITNAGFSAITTSTVSPQNFCAGASVNVSFTTNGSANAGNIFTAQLSTSAGSFNGAVSIGTLASASAGTIACVIPSGSATGSLYRIRVISSSPAVTGTDVGPISISAQVAAAGAISGNTQVCAGTSAAYSIASIANATTYNWTLPQGGTITSGAGTPSINVSFSASAQPGNVTVYGSNANCTGGSSSAAVTILAPPATPTAASVSGCAGTPVTLSGTPSGGTYSLPNPYSGPSSSYTYTITGANGCTATSAPASVTVNPLPVVSFSGLASSYSVTDAPVTLTGSPSGGSFTGPGMSGNEFSPATAGTGGPYTITYFYTDGNSCSNSSSQQTTVGTPCATPAQPGAISATNGTTACPGDVKNYSVTTVTDATSYNWSAPNGGVITSGQGTQAVTVTYQAGFTSSSSITVSAVNSCGSSAASSLLITPNSAPAIPSAISGQSTGVCNGSNIPYSVTNIAGLTYSWSFNTADASVSGGQGTNAITASYNGIYASGILSVTASNGCGTSAARSLTINAIPAVPGAITGASAVCAFQTGVPYSIAAVSGASNYTWTGPTQSKILDGNTISNNNSLTTPSNSITVNYKNKSGNLRVSASNACGSSANRILAITFVCREAFTDVAALPVSFYPNPASESLNVSFTSNEAASFTIMLTDLTGKEVVVIKGEGSVGENNMVLNLSGVKAGLYLLQVINGSQKTVQKVSVL